MARPPKDGFPTFRDGDVEICLSRKPEDRFVLHSVVLGLHSSFFKVSISERWSAPNDDTTSSDSIRWRYQLLFEEDMNDEEAPLLAKAKPEISSVSGSSNLSLDTRSIYLMHAPYVPLDDSKTKSRLALICAHRHYLETLYHKPFDFATIKFPELVHTLVHVLRLADIYGSLAIFQMPVDTAFARLKSDLDRLCGKYYFNIIHIAMLTRSPWLFQYAICRLVGDPNWADDKIRKTFNTLGIIPLVLEKRTQLRAKMLLADHAMMLAGVRLEDRGCALYTHSIILATAAYKHHLLEHLEQHDRGGWKLSSQKYRVLKDEGESEPMWTRNDELRSRFAPIRIHRLRFNTTIDRLRKEVAKHVSPLLVDHVDIDKTLLSPGSAKRKDQGLTCVEITDDDLPWKGIPW